MKKIFIIPLLSFLLVCCYIVEPETPAGTFEIYLLADASITIRELPDMALDEFVLAAYPLISMNDIIKYEWATHIVHLKKPAENKLTDLSKPGNLIDRPFIVLVNGERVYMGAIWPGYYSMMCMYPHIMLPSRNPYLIMSGIDREDKRNDIRIYTVLKNAGKLT